MTAESVIATMKTMMCFTNTAAHLRLPFCICICSMSEITFFISASPSPFAKHASASTVPMHNDLNLSCLFKTSLSVQMVEITRPQTIPRAAQTQPIIKSLFSFIVFQFQVHDGDSPPVSRRVLYQNQRFVCACFRLSPPVKVKRLKGKTVKTGGHSPNV